MTVNDSFLTHATLNERSWLKEVTVILGASFVISLFAQVSIPLYFTPIPLATQAHVILLLSCFLGAKRASLAVLLFILQGLMGLPVFSLGKSGLSHLAGPCGGYILGYLAAAFVTGLIMERASKRSIFKSFAAMGIGNVIIYLFGLCWLSRYAGSWQNVTMMGLIPFFVGDLIKLVAATQLLKGLRFFKE